MTRKDRRRLAGNNGKVVFPDHDAAAATAAELARIGGCKALSPYPCPRGGHHHLHGELPPMDGDVA